MTGYLLLGCSYLCKQNFLVVPFVVLLLLGDWRRWIAWLGVLFPGLVYLVTMLGTGALSEALLQMRSQVDLLQTGILSYLKPKMLAGLAVGSLSAVFVQRFRVERDFRLLLLYSCGLLLVSVAMIFEVFLFALHFFIFGLAAGVFVFLVIARRDELREWRVLFALTLVVSWSASLSVGYNFPALFSGQTLAVLFLYSLKDGALSVPPIQRARIKFTFAALSLFLLAFSAVLAFAWARCNSIYREATASQLRWQLDDVLPGGKGIRTNETTYRFLADAKAAIHTSKEMKKTYAVVPDCPAIWVRSSQRNPLPLDWPQETELSSPRLLEQVTRAFEREPKPRVLVQKFEANALAKGAELLSERYSIVRYVRSHMQKVGETEFFEIFQ